MLSLFKVWESLPIEQLQVTSWRNNTHFRKKLHFDIMANSDFTLFTLRLFLSIYIKTKKKKLF